MVVVLPAPLGPRMPVTAPRAAVSVSPSTAASWPYRLTSPPISTAGAAGFAGVCGAVLTHASLRRSASARRDTGHLGACRGPRPGCGPRAGLGSHMASLAEVSRIQPAVLSLMRLLLG